WALLESRADAPEKTELVELTNKDLPALLDRIDTLMANWSPEEVAIMSTISNEMDVLFRMHDRIKELLPSLESYSDPFNYMERNDLAEEGGPLDQQMGRVL